MKYSEIKKREHFEGSGVAGNNTTGGTSLNDAYRAGSSLKNLISNTAVGAQVESSPNVNNETKGSNEPKGANIGNLWNFLGIEKLTLKQKQCVYNCGMDTFGCLERCSNPNCRKQENLSDEQCKYGCMRKAISCSTGCISEIQEPPKMNNIFSNNSNDPIVTLPVGVNPTQSSQTPRITTGSSISISSDNSLISPCEVHGVYESLDTYAPFDMRVWPQKGKSGWTLSELSKMRNSGYNAPNVIEVQMNHGLYPIKTDEPVVEFDYTDK